MTGRGRRSARFFGHHIFTARDPDGNEVAVSTSHASNLPV